MAKIRWRLVIGLVSLGLTVVLSFPAAAVHQASNRVADIWPNRAPIGEIWPNGLLAGDSSGGDEAP